jgi:hypothetical protein
METRLWKKATKMNKSMKRKIGAFRLVPMLPSGLSTQDFMRKTNRVMMGEGDTFVAAEKGKNPVPYDASLLMISNRRRHWRR